MTANPMFQEALCDRHVARSSHSNFTFVDFCAEIGGFRIALARLGGKCLGYAEIDRQAIAFYEDNFNDDCVVRLGDLNRLNNINITADLFTGGIPC